MASVTASGLLMGSNSMPAIRPAIQHGVLKVVRGIIVHQTGGPTAQGTLDGYIKGPNGAHFLIEKDGRVYQTASLKSKTHHVGNLRPKCFETYSCDRAELTLIAEKKWAEVAAVEFGKSVPERFPSNSDAIGIELVGVAILAPKWKRPGMPKNVIDDLTGEKGIYEDPTLAQDMALQKLIKDLQSVFSLPRDQVFPHSQVSRKNPTEAVKANWREKG